MVSSWRSASLGLSPQEREQTWTSFEILLGL
jgi:hypothetical protein